MSNDINGYQLDRCFGASGCPNGCSQPQIKDVGIILPVSKLSASDMSPGFPDNFQKI